MLRPLYRNIVFFIFLKYFVFYVVLMFKNNDFTFIELGSLRDAQDLFYYLWIFLFLPVSCTALFSAPIFVSFKLNNGIIFILIMTGILVAEYFFYTYFASPTDKMNGLYNALIGLSLFIVLFFKSIVKIFKPHDNQKLVDRLLDM